MHCVKSAPVHITTEINLTVPDCNYTVHRCLHRMAPEYLSELCLPVKLRPSRYQLRSSQSNQLLFYLSSYSPMDLVRLLLLDLPSGTIYLNIYVILGVN